MCAYLVSKSTSYQGSPYHTKYRRPKSPILEPPRPSGGYCCSPRLTIISTSSFSTWCCGAGSFSAAEFAATAPTNVVQPAARRKGAASTASRLRARKLNPGPPRCAATSLAAELNPRWASGSEDVPSRSLMEGIFSMQGHRLHNSARATVRRVPTTARRMKIGAGQRGHVLLISYPVREEKHWIGRRVGR